MNLPKYILRRAAFGVFVLLSVMTITFILSHSLGGDPIYAWLGKAAGLHPELAQAYIQKYHLKDPVLVQYYYYLLSLAQGNMGYSPSRNFLPVTEVILETLPFTIQIALFAIVMSLVVGVLLGVVSARYNHTPIDTGIRAFYMTGYASPPFFVALLLLIIFTYTLGILPSGGAFDPTLTKPTWITGLPILDSLIEGNFPYFTSALLHVILPSSALALVTFGIVTRVLRSSLLEIMHANYIRTARAKGLDENTVFYKHGLRHALIPVVSLSSLIVTWLITGTIFVENVFSYPGMGRYVVQALNGQDYPGILGTTIVFALVIVGANLVADILYAVVDPQVRLG
ncbi:MAG TPA: ABC transporter permease [Methylomirabilota bacterium]|nr:ABC transporter permease [Methylomirabilota bacterium]